MIRLLNGLDPHDAARHDVRFESEMTSTDQTSTSRSPVLVPSERT